MSLNEFLEKAVTRPAWSEQEESDVLQPFTYCASAPEENLFQKTLVAYNYWLKIDPEKIKAIIQLNDKINNALTMLDDIEDDSELRGGQPVAHKVYGVPRSINVACYALYQAYEQLSGFPTDTPEAALKRNAILTEEMLTFHRGQGIEIFWRDTGIRPSIEQYISMAKNKTSSFFRLFIRLAMSFSDEPGDAYLPLLDILGVYDQIRDDLVSLDSDIVSHSGSFTQGKAFAEDITEGKYSFLVAHAMTVDPNNTWLLDVLKQRTTDRELKLDVIRYLKDKTKSFAYTLSVLDELESQLRQELKRLGGNSALEKLFDLLHISPSATANNSERDPADLRAIVRAGYDRVAPDFLAASYESSGTKSLGLRKLYVEKVLSRLSANSRILEVGCGAGIPCTKDILEGGHTVTAVDISSTQIDLAKTNLKTFLSPSPSSSDSTPQLTLLCADMTTLSFPPGSLDAVVAFYSLCHLPQTDQQSMIRKIISWLRPGGLLLANFVEMPEDEFYEDWLGVNMFLSGRSSQENSELIAGEQGISILENQVGEENFREETARIQWVLAVKDL